jgi:hypothetical protein
LELALVACSTGRTGTGRSYFIRVELGIHENRGYTWIFGLDWTEKCVFGAVIGRELGSRELGLACQL